MYLEVYDRIDSATMTGRLCHPVTELFLVQWPEQESLYRDTVARRARCTDMTDADATRSARRSSPSAPTTTASIG